MSTDQDTIRWIYDHLRATLERDDRGREMYLSKSKEKMAVAVGCLAALSFSVTKIEWAFGSGWLVVFVLLAGYAGWCIARALVTGCHCLDIADAAVVGVKSLHKSLDSRDIEQRDSMETHAGLAANVASVILENRDIMNKRRHLAPTLNKYTLRGVGLTIVVVIFAVIGDTISSHIAAQAESEHASNVRIEQP